MKKILYYILIIFIFSLQLHQVYAEEFNITSKNVILYNMNDNKVLYELSSEERVQIASLTKIMTTIVAIENMTNLEEEVVITKDALKGIEDYTKVGYKVGDVTNIKDLLYSTILPSGADAANALAIHIGGSIDGFVDMMNEEAKRLGLVNTSFDNPIGMDSDNNYSTASDMAKLLIYCLENNTFKEIFQTKEYFISSLNKTIKTTLVGYSKSYGLDTSYIMGAKSGFTDEAGLCLASTSQIDDVNYLLITLGADTTNRSNAVADSLEIYDYYSSYYGYQLIIKKDQLFKSLSVKWGEVDSYDLVSSDNVYLYLSNDIRKRNIKYIYEGIEEINYKVKKGDKLGVIKVVYNDDVLTTYDIYLDKELKYYHPILYIIIFILFIIMISSLRLCFKGSNKRKNKVSRKKIKRKRR